MNDITVHYKVTTKASDIKCNHVDWPRFFFSVLMQLIFFVSFPPPTHTAYKELGIDQELVMQMRRSYDTRPPRMDDDHPFWHGNDRRYRKLSPDQLERSRAESLKDTAERIMPFFDSVIVPSIRSGNKCIIVSHANTIRTLVKQIDNISDEEIKGMSIPTGIPLLYRVDKNLKPVDPSCELEFRYMVEPKGE
jgi:bisphosphoglycerate-dependent phosphoglycerate mutase family 1